MTRPQFCKWQLVHLGGMCRIEIRIKKGTLMEELIRFLLFFRIILDKKAFL